MITIVSYNVVLQMEIHNMNPSLKDAGFLLVLTKLLSVFQTKYFLFRSLELSVPV